MWLNQVSTVFLLFCLYKSTIAFVAKSHLMRRSSILRSAADAFALGQLGISFVSYINPPGDWAKSMDNFRKKIVNPLANHKPSFEYNVKNDPYHVKRVSIENEIRMIYNNKDNSMGTYHVVYGVKGAGKTYTAASVLNGVPGVIRICVSQADMAMTIISKIAKICGLTLIDKDVDLSVFNPILMEAKNMRNGLPLTFVLEVERGSSSQDVVSLVKQVPKVLALNANVMIVLSEANAVLGFGEDKRQSFLFVDGMEVSEAKEYAKKKYPSIQDHDIDSFIEKVGTLPLDIGLFCAHLSRGFSADTFITNIIKQAKRDLVAFAHQPILKALKNHPEGVQVEFFGGIEDKGVLLSEPKFVGVAMKTRNVIVYHFQSGEYRLFSTAHKTAIKGYEISE